MISGLPAAASLTAAPSNLLQTYGTNYIATRVGTAVITVRGLQCVPQGVNKPQPTTCVLLKIHVS